MRRHSRFLQVHAQVDAARAALALGMCKLAGVDRLSVVAGARLY